MVTSQWDELVVRDCGHGFDEFGLSQSWIRRALKVSAFLYQYYFRVQSWGMEKVKSPSPLIFIANHGGTIPLDGVMLYHDIIRNIKPKRLPRPVADHFVSLVPGIGTLMARLGVVGGSRANVEFLLEKKESLIIFPEGVTGIAKPYSQKYKIQDWRQGHVELAIKYRAALVPTAIIGSEEQMPLLGKMESFGFLGLPYLPIPLTLFPFPVKYHIVYGKPYYPHRDLGGSDKVTPHPEVIKKIADKSKKMLEDLLKEGMAKRKGLF